LTNQQGLVLAGLIVLITIVAYFPSMRGGFVWDDGIYITGNPLVRASDGLRRFWFTTEAFDYYPITWSLWWLEWRRWGEAATGYHVLSVLLHAINAVLVWLVLRRLDIPGAWFAAVAFAIHPVNVASVAWISEQKNTLAMLFCVLTVLFYLRFNQEDDRVWYLSSLVAFILALLSKSAVVMLPMVLLACVWWARRTVRVTDLLRTAPFFLLSFIFGVVTIWFQNNRVLLGHPARTDSLMSRIIGSGWALWFYVYKAILPVKLTAIYPMWKIDTSIWLSYLPVLLLTACFATFYLNRRAWGRPWLFAFGCFVIMLFPVLGFFDQSFYQYSLVADHWQYFSLIGVIGLAMAGGVWVYRRSGPFGRYSICVIWASLMLSLGCATWSRTHVYANSEALWSDVIAKNPSAWSAHVNLGNAFLQVGKIQNAVAEYEEALKIEPFLAEPHNNLGTILIRSGRLPEAIAHYEQALRIKLDYPEAQNNLGLALMGVGEFDAAVQHLKAAIQLNPNYGEAQYNLAVVLANQGRTNEAILQLERAVEVEPNRPEFRRQLEALRRLKSTP
jgi:Tfp pilus assembly protein PilF